jgi:hypothetical protein
LNTYWQLLLATSCCLFGLAGCSHRPANYPETAPVSGTVTLDGKPLAAATICFSPSEGRSSSAVTDQAGRYELHYAGRVTGAMLGTHRVTISQVVPDEKMKASLSAEDRGLLDAGEFSLPFVESLPSRYRGLNSELSAEVKPQRNVFDFNLTSKE